MGFIIGRQDGKLRGMCSVAAIYGVLTLPSGLQLVSGPACAARVKFENINVEKGQSRVAIPVGLPAAGGQH
jgi:hypothetical protein